MFRFIHSGGRCLPFKQPLWTKFSPVIRYQRPFVTVTEAKKVPTIKQELARISSIKIKSNIPLERITAVLQRCQEEKNLDSAQQAYEFAKEHLPPSFQLYSGMIKSLVSLGEMDSVMTIYQDMLRSGFSADVELFNTMLVGFLEKKNFLRIEEIDDAMDTLGLEKDSATYATLVDAYIADRNMVKAENLFLKYRKEIQQKDDKVYTSMIRAYCRRLNVEEATRVLRFLTADGFRATLELFNELIGASVKRRNYSVAWHCFIRMEELKIKPDIVSWNGLIDVLCRSDKLEEARTHFRNLESKYGVKANTDTYSILIIAQVKEKWVQESEDLFIEMRNKGIEVSQMTWRYIIEVFARSNQMDKAFILVDQMLHEKVQPHSKLLHVLQNKCRRTGKIEWYTKRFGEMKTPSTVISPALQHKLLQQANQALNYDWEVPGSPFSVLEYQNEMKAKKEAERKKQLDEMEKKFMLTIPPEIRAKMEEKQKSLAGKRRAKTSLPKSKDVAPTKKKKLLKKKIPKEPKPDPFTAMANLEKPKKHLTTPKETRRPKSQFYWGRHRGPTA